jgi:hypothetical protein
MRLQVLAFLFALTGFIAHAEQPLKTLRTWQEFSKIVEDNKITSVDELLEHLPVDFVGGYSLIYRTKALHAELVSPPRPRVMMFGADARFILTYNSHPLERRARPGERESVETIEFLPAGQTILREIDFDGSAVPNMKRVEVNPSKCLSCHGTSPRGLWDPYNSWPGVYGSLSRGGVDFIRFQTREHQYFEQFLSLKSANPRYSFLPLTVKPLSQRSAEEKILRPFQPDIMHDAITFDDGHTSLPNQWVGMQIGDRNFERIASLMMETKYKKMRQLFQYLAKGISLDEATFGTPPALDLNKKKMECATKIETFFPKDFSRIRAPYLEFSKVVSQKLQTDYGLRKAEVEFDNMGLSKTSSGYDSNDPFDENRGPRNLIYDSINPSRVFDALFAGRSGNTSLLYVLYLMGIPSQDLSAAVIKGANYKVRDYVLAGNLNLYYGNTTECHDERGRALPDYAAGKFCFSEAVEQFFTRFIPGDFYSDPDIAYLTCDQLADRSRKAIDEAMQAGTL